MRRIHLLLILAVLTIIVFAVIIATLTQASLLQQLAAIFLGVLGGIAAVAEIVGLFDRLGVPETVAIPEIKHIIKEKSPCETTVAIWGPTGSGKSWLINAFAKTIESKYNNGYLGLEYKLFDANGIVSRSSHAIEDIPATVWVDFSQFRFTRNRTSNKFYEMMSSFSHNIYIFDNQGGASSRIGNDKEDQDELKTIIANLASADIVILALDPTMVVKNESEDYSYGFTPAEYAERVKRLFSVLDKTNPENPEKRRLYAACVTKADMIPGGIYLHPDALIEAYFGHEMSEALKVPQRGIVQTFTTSSFGFISGTSKPNHKDGLMAQVDKWQPYGVEYPFFWSFEIQEKELLKKLLRSSLWGRLTFYGNYKNYISYPKPKYEV